mmetsp:Transcript_16600/g.30014  ORF Transcript_16600/g.30014 Transcript_16600/m.30014 type:complete len:446 (-) Transcript_16600:220-1557(-)|eukprot:CAMPEP_0202485882 /NCGR_PEP_ID=MMETSP1361-20130828/4578_1 /ASSEMBLY_ACC=CAM_ASM_000849 /TAXON_ID=210615 /ORGANISM="Staurosira complex sp., Strain CCMP2646" /LENGTH=445 /DNA_ID=CAMNT_0049114865 /DNA_START=161 /DNA_END=1498 /DNA_ORIENTATION=-
MTMEDYRVSSPEPGSITSYDTNGDEVQIASRSSDLSIQSEGEHSGNIDREYTGQFEGPEKTIEVFFRKIGAEHRELTPPSHDSRVGLRTLTRADLDKICRRVRCNILSSVSNQYVDAYVLSESSLFVYPYMVMLKTCGTTTLLRCIAILIEFGRKLGLEIDWLGYSRKNFNFPGDQAFPHQSFEQELGYLHKHRSLCERLDGNGYTLGPVTSDHWFVYVADHTHRGNSNLDTDRVLNIMMFDIDESVGNMFYYNNYPTSQGESKEDETKRISREQTSRSGIDALCPGAIIDPRAFEPCGYSMNAILFRSYSTIHITPEQGSSYVSFETNQKLVSYKSLLNNVIRTFRPKRFVLTLMADELGLQQMKDNPFTASTTNAKVAATIPPTKGMNASKVQMLYKRSSLASIKVEDDCCCMMGNWVLEKDPMEEHIRKLRAEQRLLGTSFS